MYKQYFTSPIGNIQITANDQYVTSVLFTSSKEEELPNAVTKKATKQLGEYFESNRKSFDLPFQLASSSFSSLVLDEVSKIEFGKTATYASIASALGNKNKVRAVGNANAKNNLLVVIPCYRIIGSNGSLTGYAGGLKRKQWLLEHEGALAQKSLF